MRNYIINHPQVYERRQVVSSASCVNVNFRWSSNTTSLLPTGQAKFQVVVSNDPHFGTYSRSIPSWTFSGDNQNPFNVPSSTTYWAGAETSSSSINMSPGVFAGDAMPIPAGAQTTAVDSASTFGVGVQSGSKFLFGTFYWKVLTKTPYGISEWEDGDPFTVKDCPKPGEDPNTKVSSFKPAKDPGHALVPEGSRGPQAYATGFTGCGTDVFVVNIFRNSGTNFHPVPKGFTAVYELKISTDPKFSSFGIPLTKSTGLSSFRWASNSTTVVNPQLGLSGDVDPFTDGVQNQPEKGKTYYIQVGAALKAINGGKSIPWPLEPPTSFVACGTIQPASFWDPDSAVDDVGRDRTGNAQEVILTGESISQEDLDLILKNLDIIKIIIKLIRSGVLDFN